MISLEFKPEYGYISGPLVFFIFSLFLGMVLESRRNKFTQFQFISCIIGTCFSLMAYSSYCHMHQPQTIWYLISIVIVAAIASQIAGYCSAFLNKENIISK